VTCRKTITQVTKKMQSISAHTHTPGSARSIQQPVPLDGSLGHAALPQWPVCIVCACVYVCVFVHAIQWLTRSRSTSTMACAYCVCMRVRVCICACHWMAHSVTQHFHNGLCVLCVHACTCVYLCMSLDGSLGHAAFPQWPVCIVCACVYVCVFVHAIGWLTWSRSTSTMACAYCVCMRVRVCVCVCLCMPLDGSLGHAALPQWPVCIVCACVYVCVFVHVIGWLTRSRSTSTMACMYCVCMRVRVCICACH